MSEAKQAKVTEPEETRVIEVRRTVKKEVEEVKSSTRLIFELKENGWELHMPNAANFTIPELEQAIEQLKRLREE